MVPSIQLSFESLPRKGLSFDQEKQDSVERIKVMKCLEKKYVCVNYLSDDAIDVNEESRRRMVEWYYQTVDYFELSRNSAQIAMSCADRFLCTSEGQPFLLDKILYQLACVTAFYMAIKVHETVELGVSTMVKLCRGAFTQEQLLVTEQSILNAIDWAVNPPIPSSFMTHFISMLPRNVSCDTRRDLMDLACYQAEQDLLDYFKGALAPKSAVALESLTRAMSQFPEISQRVRSAFFRALEKVAAFSREMNNSECSFAGKNCYTTCHSKGQQRTSIIHRRQ